jgi:hypothetical protein
MVELHDQKTNPYCKEREKLRQNLTFILTFILTSYPTSEGGIFAQRDNNIACEQGEIYVQRWDLCRGYQ